MDTIKIGGKEHPIELRYYTVRKIFRVYDLFYKNRMKNDVLPDSFFVWSVWKCLIFRPVWFYHKIPFPFRLLFGIFFFPFKRPFRTKHALMKTIRKDEFMQIIQFVGNKVLDIKVNDSAVTEGRDSGNVAH